MDLTSGQMLKGYLNRLIEKLWGLLGGVHS